MGISSGCKIGINHLGRKNLGEPKVREYQDEIRRLISSLGTSGVFNAISFQKASRAGVAFFGFPAMIAALNAPIETPATISG